MKNYVWEFTNQRKLDKKEFINYFERKIFRTIRKYQMLPRDRIFKIKDDKTINNKVLKEIIEQKFQVDYSKKPNISSENLSSAAEEIFDRVLDGKFEGPSPEDKPFRPLYFHSDKEIEVYAKLKDKKSEKPKRNKKIQELFSKFMKKNPDLELNVVKTLKQIKED